MKPAQRAARYVVGTFTENVFLKLACLAAAFGYYVFLHGAQRAERSFSVSVVTLLPGERTGRTLLNPPPANVRVTLRGGRQMLDELKAEDLGTVQLDVRSATATYATFDTSTLKIPIGLASSVDPAGIDLRWDDIVTRSLPVLVVTSGQPAAGFVVDGQPSAEPKVVLAHGPRSLLETLQNARVEAFDVTGLTTGTFARKLPLEPPPPRVDLLEASTTVTLQIARARVERVYTRPVQVVGPPRAVTVPPEVDVRISGPPEIVEALRPELVVPVAQLPAPSGEGRGATSNVPVTVNIDGCTSLVLPGTVVVKWGASGG